MAWNKVKLRNVDERERTQLNLEVETLGKLDHKNIIHFYGTWAHEKDKSADITINFITELCDHTLRECAASPPAGPACQLPQG